jgi:hypothetical protein
MDTAFAKINPGVIILVPYRSCIQKRIHSKPVTICFLRVPVVISFVIQSRSAMRYHSPIKSIDMKKTTAILSALVILISSASYAGYKTSEHRILSSFLPDRVPHALEKDTDSSKREVAFTKLPANIQYAVKTQYQNFIPKDKVTEMINDGTSTYYVTVENDRRIIELLCSASGEITLISNTRK